MLCEVKIVSVRFTLYRLSRKLKPSLDPSVLKLIKTNPFLSRSDPKYTNSYVESFLQRDLPIPEITRLHSPPLFPRCPLPSNDGVRPGAGLEGLSELRRILPEVEMEDDRVDLYKHHMIVVDGWRTWRPKTSRAIGSIFDIETYTSSLSPPTRPQSTDLDNIDELFLPSSPDTEVPPIQSLMDAKMGKSSIVTL
jgi:hypothetical protein